MKRLHVERRLGACSQRAAAASARVVEDGGYFAKHVPALEVVRTEGNLRVTCFLRALRHRRSRSTCLGPVGEREADLRRRT